MHIQDNIITLHKRDGTTFDLGESLLTNTTSISGSLSNYTLLSTTASISGGLNTRVSTLETNTTNITGGLTQLDARYVNVDGDTMTGPLIINYDSPSVSGASLQINADGNARIRLNNPSGGDAWTEYSFAENGNDRWAIYSENAIIPKFAVFDYSANVDRMVFTDTYTSIKDQYGFNILYSEGDTGDTYINPDHADSDLIVSTKNATALRVYSDINPSGEYVQVSIPLTVSNIAGTNDAIVTHDTNGRLRDSGVTVAGITGNFANYTLLSTTASISGNLQSQIDNKVSKSGDTMTGDLLVSYGGGGPITKNIEITNQKVTVLNQNAAAIERVTIEPTNVTVYDINAGNGGETIYGRGFIDNNPFGPGSSSSFAIKLDGLEFIKCINDGYGGNISVKLYNDVIVDSISGASGNIVTHDASGKLLDSGQSIPTSATFLTDYDNRYVNVTGDTMTGNLVVNGTVTCLSGSAATPGFNFSTEPDCGLYLVGTNNIALATNGTQRVSIADGTTTVTNSFQVNNAVTVFRNINSTDAAAVTTYGQMTGGTSTNQVSSIRNEPSVQNSTGNKTGKVGLSGNRTNVKSASTLVNNITVTGIAGWYDTPDFSTALGAGGVLNITNYYGGYVADWTTPAANISASNQYGIYIERPTKGTVSNYPIYVAGGNSYFGGPVTLATSASNLIMNTDASICISGDNLYGWDDLLSELDLRGTGANSPTWSVFRNGISGPEFSATVMNESWASFHIPHTYAPNTSVFFHIHFSPNNTSTGVVRWGFEYTYAKRDGTFGATSTVYKNYDIPTNSQYKHFVAEIDTGVLGGGLIEPDTLICVRVFRDATDVADTFGGTVHGFTADCHFQKSRFATRLKEAPFY